MSRSGSHRNESIRRAPFGGYTSRAKKARLGPLPSKKMTAIRKSLLCLAACGWTLLAPSLALAYTIVFKDESTLIALEKYTIEGDQAIVTLTNGTKTSFPAAEIDVAKTEELNRLGVSRGIVLDGSPSSAATGSATTDTIADLVKSGYGAVRLPEEPEAAKVSRTRAGNLDLFTLRRSDPPNPAIAADVRAALAAEGQESSALFAGTRQSRLLVETIAENETQVFAALNASAAALLSARQKHPDLEALELVMATSERSRAAQFLLTPDSAQRLVDMEVSSAEYFLLNVQF